MRRMKYWIVRGWIGLLMVSALYGQPSHYGVEFLVNTIDREGSVTNPAIASQPNGDFVIIWCSAKTGVYAKIFPAQPQVHSLQSFSLINPPVNSTEQSCRPYFTWQKPSSLRIIFSGRSSIICTSTPCLISLPPGSSPEFMIPVM